ncbi:hypothetical protein BH09BAC5_BH09BAC5_03740 [soil metagenome]
MNSSNFLRRSFLSILLLLAPFFAMASNYYWVGGTGDWSDYANHWSTTSGGLIFHVQEPTPFDDVFFDANSFPTLNDSVKISATIFTCRDMDWTGATNAPVFYASSPTSSFSIYGSFILNYNMTWQYPSDIYFESTVPGAIISSGGQILNSVSFNGNGGTWTLMDSLYVSTLACNNGIFYSNNKTIRGWQYNFGMQAYLGTSELFVEGGSFSGYGPGLDADSATINFLLNGQMYLNGGIFHDVNFYGGGYLMGLFGNSFDKLVVTAGPFEINGDNTFDTLLLNNPGYITILDAGSTQTIIDQLSDNGSCAGVVQLKSSIPTTPAILSKASGNVTLNYMLMDGITATGGATFIANNTITISNVTGWTVSSPIAQNLYWVGGTGDLNDPAHWSATSGGTGGSCIPTLLDDVFFDANSFPTTNDSVYFDNAGFSCHTMDWTGVANSPVFFGTGQINIYGSFILDNNMSWNMYAGSVNFESTFPGEIIYTAGQPIYSVQLNGIGGTWTLQDSLHVSTLMCSNGVFYSNNKTIRGWNLNFGMQAFLGTSKIFIDNGIFQGFGAGVDADSTTINFITYGQLNSNSVIFHDVNFYCDGYVNCFLGCSFDKMMITQGYLQIYGDNTFDTLLLNNPGFSTELDVGSTQAIIGQLSGNGSCSGLLSLKSITNSAQAYITKASGSVVLNYVLLDGIDASGGANFIANNSVVISNVTGWTINSPSQQNLFWVGGTGNWSNPSHWSFASGGPGGSCIPTPYDDVFFDANSFSSVNDTVYMDLQSIYCHTMDWSVVTNSPTFSGNDQINIFGNLLLSYNMFWNSNAGGVNFQSTSPGAMISSGGQYLNSVTCSGIGGTWTLQDSLYVSDIYCSNGIFYSNDKTIRGWNLNFGLQAFLGASEIFVENGSLNAYNPGVDVDSTTINFITNGQLISNGGIFHDVNFYGDGYLNSLVGCTFNKMVIISGSLTVDGDNTFDTLYFNNPGQSVTIAANSIQTINNSLMANATGGYPISLVSSIPGTQSTISMPAGDTACLNYIYMQDQNAIGGGVFYAGIYSSNISNNTGWQFVNCVQPISNVWPGDANYDLIVDNLDILNIGIAFNETGFTRPGASLNYVAQPCFDWPSQFITGFNTKHADCDGNGIVNFSDTLAVSLNYGLTHPFRLSAPDSTTVVAPDLYFHFPTTSVSPGSYVTVDINLGTLTFPANAIYGTAFTVNYPSAMIVPGTMSVSYNGSWLVNSGNNVHLEKNFYANSKIDFGFSRINHNNASGNGMICTLTFQVDSFATGPLSLSFSPFVVVDNNGNIIPVNNINSSVMIGINEQTESSFISIYPNPSSGMFFIDLSSKKIAPGSVITITDIAGRSVLNIPAEEQKSFTIDLSNETEGIYFMHFIMADGNVAQKKVVVVKQK